MSWDEKFAKERGIDMSKTTLPPLWWPLVFCADSRLHRHGERGGKCEVCGATEMLEEHHIVPKSRGKAFLLNGTEVELPTITLCGFGNHGALMGYPLCHGMAHAERLHFRVHAEQDVFSWLDEQMKEHFFTVGTSQWLEFLITDKPVKYQTALMLEGWRAL